MIAIRCGSKTFGRITEQGLIEIKCSSRFCKDHPNEVVFHEFDPKTGNLVRTKKYKEPKGENRQREG